MPTLTLCGVSINFLLHAERTIGCFHSTYNYCTAPSRTRMYVRVRCRIPPSNPTTRECGPRRSVTTAVVPLDSYYYLLLAPSDRPGRQRLHHDRRASRVGGLLGSSDCAGRRGRGARGGETCSYHPLWWSADILARITADYTRNLEASCLRKISSDRHEQQDLFFIRNTAQQWYDFEILDNRVGSSSGKK